MGKYYGVTRSSGENSLAHFGILGQKWGIRRFQNEDGTLTEEGKRRYTKSDNTLTDEGKKWYQNKLDKDYDRAKKNFDTEKKPKKSDYDDEDIYYDSLGQYESIKADFNVRKGMKKFFEKNQNAKISDLEDEYDRLSSKYYDVYLPYLKEQRKKNKRTAFDD